LSNSKGYLNALAKNDVTFVELSQMATFLS